MLEVSSPDLIIQGTPEWRQVRIGKVTGSKVTVVMSKGTRGKEEAVGRYKYRLKLALERLSGVEQHDDVYENHSMRWGTEHEPDARIAYELARGVFVDQVGFINHPEIPWCGFSPDGLVNDDGLIELKCPNTSTHFATIREALAKPPNTRHEVIPVGYKRQCLLGLSTTGRDWIDWNTYDPRVCGIVSEDGDQYIPDLFTIRVNRDEPAIKEMESEIRRFNEEIEEMIDEIKTQGTATRRMRS